MNVSRLNSALLGFVFICSSAIEAQVTDQDLAKADSTNWLSYSGSYSSQRHSHLKEIHTGNVASLTAKWIYHMPGPGQLEAVPVVVNGVMYVSQANAVRALDAAAGRLIWEYQRPGAARGRSRGLAVYENKIFFGTSDASVVALDSRTGHLVWEAKIGGEGVRYQGSAPLVVRGKIILGASSPAGGFVEALDAKTGKSLWRWNAIPQAGAPGSETWAGDSWKLGGGPTWLTGSYDPDLNLVYWGTGQPDPDFDGDGRKGDNLYTDCLVALDPDTGKLKWFFQFTPHDTHDWDAVEIPVLVDAPYQGGPRKLLLQANRNGYYYVLDRTNGKFLHGSPFVKLLTWSTGLTETGRPIVVPGMEPSVQGTKVCPSTSGATNWPSPAFDPDTQLFYVMAQEGCGVNYKAKASALDGAVGSGTGYTASPVEQETWQLYLRALDMSTGKLVWERKQIGGKYYGPGLLSVAGGLVFAAGLQGYLTAHDAKTGQDLWHFNTGDIITASPMAYGFEGHEYIAVVSGSNVISFGLPGQ